MDLLTEPVIFYIFLRFNEEGLRRLKEEDFYSCLF